MADVAATPLRGGPLDLSLPTEGCGGPWLDEIVERSTLSPDPLVLRAPLPIARQYESSTADLRLRTLGAGAVLFGADSWAVIGGGDPAAAACVVDSEAFVAAMRRVLVAGS